MTTSFVLEGRFVDVFEQRIKVGKLRIDNGKILAFEECGSSSSALYMPGFVDAHIHVESSLLVPTEFARLALPHGTIATVSDPHEIGNVLGVKGVLYMLKNAENTPLKIYFGAPSCVPATSAALETAGAEISSEEIAQLLDRDDIGYLAEVMNFPGVLNADKAVMSKIQAALHRNKPIDGHFPGGRGEDAKRYIEAGYPEQTTISTDHECFSLEEAIDKLEYGMKISIREGSAARNLEALHPLFEKVSADRLMLCSDDRHPDTLIKGHINELARRLVQKGYDPLKVITSATRTAVEHYRLNVGLLRPGDPADCIKVRDLESFHVEETYIDGKLVARDGTCLVPSSPIEIVNNFSCSPIALGDIEQNGESTSIRVIDVLDGEIVTRSGEGVVTSHGGKLVSDTTTDILKLVVVNRYTASPPAIAFVRGFQLKHGALASSVGHDCHNIIAVGVSDKDIVAAVNEIVEKKGGLSIADGENRQILPLPVAGIMSDLPGEEVAELYTALDENAKKLGSPLRAPYMSLSFLALLVIPELKLSDKGLFDGRTFQFTSLELK
ncbi:MAG: adenine deaminase [Bdellovibrionales bacterium]|nr:adenine deaminase [Bdellovibrionales bacterium]